MLRVDSAPEDANHRIDRFGGSSLEDILKGDFGGRLSFAIKNSVYEIGKLNEAIAYLLPVEFYEAAFNVLWPIFNDIGLVGH